MKKVMIPFLIIGLSFGLQSGCSNFGKPALESASAREISQGKLLGINDDFGTHAWRGIPYAKAPVGKLRWKAPREAEPWQGVREANEFGHYCMQTGNPVLSYNPLKWGKAIGSEDCLFLNVLSPRYAPDEIPRGDERLPVMFWIHGGGNAGGAASHYDLTKLAGEQKVITVSINYRLGVLGWLSHPSLRALAENPEDASGNYALLDMIKALQWTRQNIASFGGDPDNITLFGESAGAFNTVALLASPQAKGLFHRAIIQSGGVEQTPVASAENYSDDAEPGEPYSSGELLLKLLVNDNKAEDRASAKQLVADMSDQQIADYLYSKSQDDFILLFPEGVMGMAVSPKMIRDGTVLPKTELFELFSQPGAYNTVPTITGLTRDEVKLFMAFDEELVDTRLMFIKKVIDSDAYERRNRYLTDGWAASSLVKLGDTLTRSGTPVWAYWFDWDEGSDGWLGNAAEVYGAAHGLDQAFIFGDWEVMPIPGIFTDENAETRQPLSDQMMEYWATFAYAGAPGTGLSGQLPEWTAWKSGGADELLNKPGQVMIFDTAADGGVRMENNALSISGLKAKLLADTSIANDKERCMFYALMFYEQRQDFDAEEYQQLNCADYPPERFSNF